jgi:hypothetical protein
MYEDETGKAYYKDETGKMYTSHSELRRMCGNKHWPASLTTEFLLARGITLHEPPIVEVNTEILPEEPT